MSVTIANSESGSSVRAKLNALYDANRNEINVFDYLTSSEISDVISYTGSIDITTKIANAIAAIPSQGGVLYFPAGAYTVTGGFTLATNCIIKGAGVSGVNLGNPTSGTTFFNNSTTSVLFTVTAPNSAVLFDSIYLRNLVAPTTGNKGIYVSSTATNCRTCYNNVIVDNFYDGIYSETGDTWWMHGCVINGFRRNGLYIHNLVNTDQGDWAISNSAFYTTVTTSGRYGVNIEGSGGGKLTNSKMIGGGHGIRINFTGLSGQISISSCYMEQMADECINIIAGIPFITIQGCFLETNSATAPAIAVNISSQFYIGNNTLSGVGTNAITFDNVSNNGTLGANQQLGFTNNETGLRFDCFNYWNLDPLFMTGRTTSNVALYNENNVGGLNGRAQLIIAQASPLNFSNNANVYAHSFIADGGSSGVVNSSDLAGAAIYLANASNSVDKVVLAANAFGTNYGILGNNAGVSTFFLGGSSTGTASSAIKALTWSADTGVVDITTELILDDGAPLSFGGGGKLSQRSLSGGTPAYVNATNIYAAAGAGGQPSYLLNAVGAYYGSIHTTGTQQWALTASSSGSNLSNTALTWDADGSIILPGLSLTGSQATTALSITPTWNTSGVPTAVFLNVTKTAAGTGALLFDVQQDSNSYFNVDCTSSHFTNIYNLSVAHAVNSNTAYLSNSGIGGTCALTLNPHGTNWMSVTVNGTGTVGQVFLGSSADNSHQSNYAFSWDELTNSVAGSGSALATNATNGFFYIPTSAGQPTGTPATSYTGSVPIEFDTTNNELNIYNNSQWNRLGIFGTNRAPSTTKTLNANYSFVVIYKYTLATGNKLILSTNAIMRIL